MAAKKIRPLTDGEVRREEGNAFSAANTHLSVNECACMQRQAKVSLSPKLSKLNWVSGPQRE